MSDEPSSNGRLTWKAPRTIRVGRFDLPCSLPEVPVTRDAGQGQIAGVRSDRGVAGAMRRILRPAVRWWTWWLVDGFVYRRIGRWISERARPGETFLEIGCGNMQLRQFLPQSVCYNALDIAFSAYHVNVVMRESRPANLIIASAYDIPLPENQASVIVCNQVMTQIPQPERVLAEIARVSKPGGVVLMTVANGFARKYERIGLDRNCINCWRFEEFKSLAVSQGLRCRRAEMAGKWVPIPRAIAPRYTYHISKSSPDERENTHFFYEFVVEK